MESLFRKFQDVYNVYVLYVNMLRIASRGWEEGTTRSECNGYSILFCKAESVLPGIAM